MHIVVLLLLMLILISKTICRLSFRVLPVVITCLVKYGHDSKMWKDSSKEQICANGRAVEALAFKIYLEIVCSNNLVVKIDPP